MQELEKILEEIESHAIEFEVFGVSDDYISVGWVKDIIRKHMVGKDNNVHTNDGWIPVEDEEHRPEEYEVVLCVTEDDYYFTAVYNKEFGFRTDDIGVDGEAVEWCSFQPRPERSKDES